MSDSPRKDRPTSKSILDAAEKKRKLADLRGKISPKKYIEYTKELLNEIANEQSLSQREKKDKIDLTIDRMLRQGEILFEKKLHLMSVQLKLNLLKRRHLFLDFKRRMLSIIRTKKREEEDYREEKREARESDAQRKLEAKREDELKIAAEQLAQQRKQSDSQKAVTKKPEPEPNPENNGNDFAENILDFTDLYLQITGHVLTFLGEDTQELQQKMRELDFTELAPEIFEKKLFEMIDLVDNMFDKAKATLDKGQIPVLNVCYERISKDLMQWLSTGGLPRYTDEDRKDLQQSMQTALKPQYPSESQVQPKENQGKFQSMRKKIAQEVEALIEAQYGSPETPKASLLKGTTPEGSPSEKSKEATPEEPKEGQKPYRPWDTRLPKRPTPQNKS